MCNAEDPWGERTAVVPGLKAAIGAKKGVLHHIFAVRDRAGHPGAVPMKPRPKGADGFQKREISGFELSGVFHKPACLCLAVRCGSRSVSPKVVRAPGFEPRPLGDGAAARPRWFPIRRAGPAPRVGTLLRPAGRRVFPVLLAPIDSQVEQPI